MIYQPELGDLNDPSNPARLHGLYLLLGTNPDDTQYRGSVEISYLSMFKAYKLIWTIQTQPVQYLTGRGTLQGDKLVVIDTDNNTITYALQPDGTLAGVWTDSNGSTGTELLART